MSQENNRVLKNLERILKKQRPILQAAVDTILTQDVSNYPIFVMAQTEVEIGITLIKSGQLEDNWLINASTLEEFHAKQVISVDKIDDFRQLYKSHGGELCIFAFLADSGKFLFIP